MTSTPISEDHMHPHEAAAAAAILLGAGIIGAIINVIRTRG